MKLGLLCLALLLTTAATTADAGPREKRRAKRHAANAAKLFQAKNYDLALEEFKKAYDVFPVPALLYNMGQCHLFLGEHEQAIDRFESFLREKPDTPYKKDVQRLIAEAKTELDKQQRTVDEARERSTPPIETVVPPPPPPPKLVDRPPPVKVEDKDDSVYEKWWFWTVIGGVAVAGGTAIAFAATSGDNTVLPERELGIIDRR